MEIQRPTPEEWDPDVGGVEIDKGPPILAQAMSFCAGRGVETALMGEHVLAATTNLPLADNLLGAVSTTTGELTALCWIGGNITPVGFDEDEFGLLAREIRRHGQRFSSIVGPAEQVRGLWQYAQHFLPEPRDIRWRQPSMEISWQPTIEADPRVVPTDMGDFSILFNASVRMFTEEVGYSPLVSGGGYERRVRSLISSGRSLSRVAETPNGREVIFKADLGTVAFGVTQIQGVWVHPRYRGLGLAAPAVASVVNYAHQHIASTVSLYVNDYNTAALATYRRVGFVSSGEFATILF